MTFLDLSDNRFVGSMPQQWTNMERLTYMDLTGNALTGTLPPTINPWLFYAGPPRPPRPSPPAVSPSPVPSPADSSEPEAGLGVPGRSPPAVLGSAGGGGDSGGGGGGSGGSNTGAIVGGVVGGIAALAAAAGVCAWAQVRRRRRRPSGDPDPSGKPWESVVGAGPEVPGGMDLPGGSQGTELGTKGMTKAFVNKGLSEVPGGSSARVAAQALVASAAMGSASATVDSTSMSRQVSSLFSMHWCIDIMCP